MKKIEANSLQRLSIFELHQKGFLLKDSPTKKAYISWLGMDATKQHARFSIYLPGSLKELGWIEFSGGLNDISVTSMKCNFGGMRYWFLCPICSRRIGVLYNLSGQFICRYCGRLTYSSRNQTRTLKYNVSIIDLEKVASTVGRKFYKGKPTRKYRRLLRMEAQFKASFKQLTGLEIE